jgi:S-methylmethionine-dependent homocysteine/selenocysteine methylase
LKFLSREKEWMRRIRKRLDFFVSTKMNGALAKLLKIRNPILLDGGLGSEIERRGVDAGLPLWSANAVFRAPDVLMQIHRDYIQAGADIVATCTFRTTARTFRRASLPDQSEKLTRDAVAIAQEARSEFPDRTVLIAGSVGPLEDCYRPDLVPSPRDIRTEHAEHIGRLVEAGVDLIFLETMGTLLEARIAAEEAQKSGGEYMVSFLGEKGGAIFSGESLHDAVKAVAPLSPSAICVNCVSPKVIAPLLQNLLQAVRDLPVPHRCPVGVYANVGSTDVNFSSPIVCEVDPEEYGEFARRWHRAGFQLIGGCCGTTPDHIAAIAKAFALRNQKKSL